MEVSLKCSDPLFSNANESDREFKYGLTRSYLRLTKS